MSIRFLAEGEKPERDPELALGVEASTRILGISFRCPGRDVDPRPGRACNVSNLPTALMQTSAADHARLLRRRMLGRRVPPDVMIRLRFGGRLCGTRRLR
jgi:hypothetical protein